MAGLEALGQGCNSNRNMQLGKSEKDSVDAKNVITLMLAPSLKRAEARNQYGQNAASCLKKELC